MSNPRFYCPPAFCTLSAGAELLLPENAARHASRALRLRVGAPLHLFNGLGGEYSAVIIAIERERVSVKILAWHDLEREAPINLTLVQALQSGDKMDMTVQKAVELGVTQIIPVRTARSVLRLDGERAERRVEHWRGVAIAACEQCGRNRLPSIQAIEHLSSYLGAAHPTQAAQALRLLLDPEAQQDLQQLAAPLPGQPIELLIGAEGGLTPVEIEQAADAAYLGVRLGPRVLRTETAGLAALAAMQCLWGDFGGNRH